MALTAEQYAVMADFAATLKRHRNEIEQLTDKVLNDVGQRKIQLAELKAQAGESPFSAGDVESVDSLIAFHQGNLVSTVVTLLTLPGMAQVLTANGYTVTAPQ